MTIAGSAAPKSKPAERMLLPEAELVDEETQSQQPVDDREHPARFMT